MERKLVTLWHMVTVLNVCDVHCAVINDGVTLVSIYTYLLIVGGEGE